MKTKGKVVTEEEIDHAVIAQANDDTAWEKPVKVRKPKLTAVTLPPTLAAQAAFFARLHHEPTLENWLKRVIRERLDMEEAAFAGLKKDLLTKNGQ